MGEEIIINNEHMQNYYCILVSLLKLINVKYIFTGEERTILRNNCPSVTAITIDQEANY